MSGSPPGAQPPDLRRAWDEHAPRWAAWARTPGHDAGWRVNLPTLLELVPPPGRLTLDLGCGEGRLARELARRGYSVIGVDGSPAMAHFAVTHDEPATAAVADVAALPLAGAIADLAVAHMSFQDVDDMPGALAEAARVLEPGGSLCLAIVHPLNSAGRFASREPDAPFVIEGSYLERFRYVEDVERRGLRMVFASDHHPLWVWSRALEDAGFVIEAMREPADPEDPRWTRLPLFLHLRARLRDRTHVR